MREQHERGVDDDTIRLAPPVDPWARTQEPPTTEYPWPAGCPPRNRPRVFGRVYELILAGQRDGEHRYVGMTEKTLHQRVHGPSGHTSPASIAKDPWKANILPGKAGYRLLEKVYDTGDPAENDRALRRAEAFWIDRLRPPRNVVRPVRPPATAPQPPRRQPRPVRRPPTRTELARRRRNRRTVARMTVLAVLTVALVYLFARATLMLHLPWPAAPYIVSGALGPYLGWRAFVRLDRMRRRVTR